MSTPIHANDEVLAGVHQEFRDLSGSLHGARDPLRTQADRVTAGAGELAGALEDGVTTFLLSWGAALAATSDSAGTIAANVGHFSVDLHAVDRASS